MKQGMIVCCLVLTSHLVFGATYYVSPDGADTNSGTLNQPFATVAAGVARLKPGDALYLRAGRYRDPIVIDGLAGVDGQAITISAVPGEKVILDGTDVLTGQWQKVRPDSPAGKLIQPEQWQRMSGDLYAMTLDEDIYLLIYQDMIMDAACWPNTSWDAPYRLDRSKVLRRANEKSKFGEFHDAAPTIEAVREASSWLTYDRSQYTHLNSESIGETGIDFTGAVMVMNHGWMNYAVKITEHKAGQNFFKWDTGFSGSGKLKEQVDKFFTKHVKWDNPRMFTKSRHAGVHYFLEGMPSLDRAKEWWYHKPTKTLYFVMPKGQVPESGLAKGKRRDYMLTVTNSKYVDIKGLEFFGSAFKVMDCTYTGVEDCNLTFSSYNKLVYDDFQMPLTAIIRNKRGKDTHFYNRLKNCQFKYLDGNAFEGRSGGLLVDNVLIYQTQHTSLGTDSRSASIDRCSVIRRMSISDVGASVGIKGSGQCIYELNNITRFGGLQYDGAALQSGGRDPVIYRYNWSHDHPKGSFRFDSGSFPKFSNAYGEMSYNVARNTPAGYRLKGDDHLFHNNILMGSAKQDSVELDAQGGKAAASVVLFNMERWASENKRTLVANNAVTEFWSGDRKNGTVLSVMKSNVTGKFRTHLRDPANLDFRPRKDSPLVDKGYSITKEDVAWKTVPITGKENHIGKPDIGAYEYGAKYYWIPGFQYPYASTPVPPNNTKTAKNGCDLMYLAGYKAQKHIVYFGTAPDELKQVDDHNNDVNIYSPGKLESGKTYYWRVDAIRDGKTIQGELWRFRTE